MLRAAVILFILGLLPSQVFAQARIALLIGNQAYTPKVGVLRNPHEDVALVGAALKRLGFQVKRIANGESSRSIAQEWGVAHTTVARAVA